MILEVLNPSGTDLAMTPQHEDAAVQGGKVFAEEMDPGRNTPRVTEIRPKEERSPFKEVVVGGDGLKTLWL